jgi:hypothetical protein
VFWDLFHQISNRNLDLFYENITITFFMVVGILRYVVVIRNKSAVCDILDYFNWTAFEKDNPLAMKMRRQTYLLISKLYWILYTMGTFAIWFWFAFPFFKNKEPYPFPVPVYLPFDFTDYYGLFYGIIFVCEYITCFLNGLITNLFCGVIICISHEMNMLAEMLTTELAKEDPDFDMLKLIVDRYNNNHR